MVNRGRIQDPAVAGEFEHLIARLRGFLSQSFDADGNLIVADPNLAVVPVGGYIPYAGATAPNGWLLCDGSQVSRVDYKTLFDSIGTTWGAGDGSTTFNVPDIRGRAPIGAGTGSGLTARTLAATVGEETHLLTGGESGTSSHSHSLLVPNGVGVTTVVSTTTATGTTVSGLVSNSGEANASTAHNNMPPSLVSNFIIFAGRDTV